MGVFRQKRCPKFRCPGPRVGAEVFGRSNPESVNFGPTGGIATFSGIVGKRGTVASGTPATIRREENDFAVPRFSTSPSAVLEWGFGRKRCPNLGVQVGQPGVQVEVQVPKIWESRPRFWGDLSRNRAISDRPADS